MMESDEFMLSICFDQAGVDVGVGGEDYGHGDVVLRLDNAAGDRVRMSPDRARGLAEDLIAVAEEAERRYGQAPGGHR